MKVIHSFWSKPSLALQKVAGGRRDGGWLRSKYQFYSYALSCLRANETFGGIGLITDKVGKEILVDAMELPYTKVSVLLDELNGYPSELWAIGKLYSYEIQREPFLHIDNDVFLWKNFRQDILNAELVAQHPEYNLIHNKEVLETSDALGIVLPDFIQRIDRKAIHSSNAGVIGGNNSRFFSKLMRASFDFIDSIVDKIPKSKNPGVFNVLCEQLFFHQMAADERLKIDYVIARTNPTSREMALFHNVPTRNSFIHVFGGSLKRDAYILDKVECTLKLEFPYHYYKTNALMKEFEI